MTEEEFKELEALLKKTKEIEPCKYYSDYEYFDLAKASACLNEAGMYIAKVEERKPVDEQRALQMLIDAAFGIINHIAGIE
ncbi:MAG: hypothetical protein LUE27_06800 [Clostridia bacterium]|nr:hypothetical protein [Clostridia bacterium]